MQLICGLMEADMQLICGLMEADAARSGFHAADVRPMQTEIRVDASQTRG